MTPPSFPALETWNWQEIEHDVTTLGFAHVRGAVGSLACRELRDLYHDEKAFRSRVVMERYRFGVGEYAYFADPLPEFVALLRARLYEALVPLANRMMEALRQPDRYPRAFSAFRRRCHSVGQTRPTPLLLRYEAGGYNCLHRDLYGPTIFPLQAMVMLGQPNSDFTGGEFVLLEQRPRQQSRAIVVAPDRGDLVIFPVSDRPVFGARGPTRATMRHGVSRVHSGQRWALGIIFHDAQ